MNVFKRLNSLFISLVLSINAMGCATYNPMALVFHKSNVLAQSDVQVEFDEYYSPDRSKLIFDANLNKKNIFPLAVRVENASQKIWVVDYEKIFLESDSGKRYHLFGEEEIKKERRKWETGYALVPTIPNVVVITLPVMIAGASSSLALSSVFYAVLLPIFIPIAVLMAGGEIWKAKKVNKQIKEDITHKTLPIRQELKPGDTVQGVVFFDIRDKRKNGPFKAIVELNDSTLNQSLVFDHSFIV